MKKNRIKIGLIFPISKPVDEHGEGIAVHCFERTYFNLKEWDNVFVMDDGGLCPELKNHFEIRESFKDNIHYHIFDYQKGLTRSWNVGGKMAFDAGADVIIFGNADASTTSVGLDELARTTVASRNDIILVGPLTNQPGHRAEQQVLNEEYMNKTNIDIESSYKNMEKVQDLLRHSLSVKPVPYINGFTMALHRDNYELIMKSREKLLKSPGSIFFDSLDVKLMLDIMKYPKTQVGVYGGTVIDWGGDREESLALVGQEDELMLWCHKALNAPMGIALGSYWHHYKGVFRK